MKIVRKRLLSLLLALMMVASLLSGTSALAADAVTVTVGSGVPDATGAVSLPVTIENNPGFAAFTLAASYSSGLALESVTVGDMCSSGLFEYNDVSTDHVIYFTFADVNNITTPSGTLFTLNFTTTDTYNSSTGAEVSVEIGGPQGGDFANMDSAQLNVTFAPGKVGGTTETSYAGGSGTEEDPYLISTAEQLTYLASVVNGGDDCQGEYFLMTNDIYLNSDEAPTENVWPAIGGNAGSINGTGTDFQGTFNGGGHFVYNLYTYDTTTDTHKALFGSVGTYGTVMNVGVTGTVGAYNYAAGIVGYNAGTIIGCVNAASVTGNDSGTRGSGGIAGVNAGTISYCYNIGAIHNLFRPAGGIAGINETAAAKIENCYNVGTITSASGDGYTGAIIATLNDSTVSNCYYLTGSAPYAVAWPVSTAGSTEEADMKTADFVALLNADAAEPMFKLDSASQPINNGYPVLTWQETKDVEPEPELFDLVGANMTLGNELAMNFFINKADLASNVSYYATITKTYADGRDDVVVTIPDSEWKSYNADYYYVAFDGVAAKEMTDAIYVQVFQEDGTAASNLWTDSVRDYAMRILENQSGKAKTMLVDMLNYGAAAQTYFGYAAEDLANSQLADAQQAYATVSVECTDTRIKGDNYVGSSLTLGSSIAMTFFFDHITSTDGMYAVVTFTDHYGNAKSATIQGSDFIRYSSTSNYWGPTINELVVADGRQPVTCTVYNADGTVYGTVTDSVESYIARMSSTDPLYGAIMKFSVSAYNYLHNS